MREAVLWFLALLAATLAAGPALGYLRIHPENTHYFQETTTDEAVMIASCAGVVPTARDCDYVMQIREMKKQGITYGRVWHFLPWAGENAIWPWARSTTPGAYMGGRGGNKFDMDTWNTLYWSRLGDAMDRCNRAGIYCEIHLFDRCGMSPGTDRRWGGNPWASDNNINNLETPDARQDGTPDFYMYATKPKLRHQQERYVRKMIDQTIRYPNMIYEIENEHWEYNDPDFGSHYARFVKDHIADKYPDSPRLVSYSSLQGDLEAFFEIPYVDIVNRHFGKKATRDPSILNDYIEPRWSKNKAINIDEFANGCKDPYALRTMCWTIVTSGGNFHIEDCLPSAKPFEICGNIRDFREKSGWDFVHAAPDKRLVASGDGYCMANPGKEYVFYFPKGGAKKVNLAKGNYVAQWWNPTKGGFSESQEFAHDGGEKTFKTPDGPDWVLHVRADS